ncbi:MAG: 7-carboxy-7-deazaguanine synthase QueE [Candidatus Latescibacterota bacterium]|nr:MAG: 7-carboxy-7-deazaguanine synthase QueE [Candidatus Latescibacterota bacterium]
MRLTDQQTGYVSEIFCSIQGEGVYVGERQVFLRTAGCATTCRWCDTVWSKERTDVCVVHGRETRELTNPVTAVEALDETLTLVRAGAPVKTVSITGGEPLEQPAFVADIARRLKDHGLRVYLETNGLEVGGLGSMGSHVDVVAMDIKLPSATGKDHWDVHRDFLGALPGVEVFVKLVVEPITPFDEIEKAVRLIAGAGRDIPLVLQPESSAYLEGTRGARGRSALLEMIERAQRFGLEHVSDVRVIPQCHRLLNVR